MQQSCLVSLKACEDLVFGKNINTVDFVYTILLDPIALRTAKTLWSFGHSECNRVYETLTTDFIK